MKNGKGVIAHPTRGLLYSFEIICDECKHFMFSDSLGRIEYSLVTNTGHTCLYCRTGRSRP